MIRRVIPISARLRAELEMRRHAPDGKEHPREAFVFGNDVGEQVKSVRTAWEKTCKRASIDPRALHFHDLRREFASRLLESSADLHDVRDFLGHANITTTSRYLQSTPTRLARAIARLDSADESTTLTTDDSATPDGCAHDAHTTPS
jgi:integrase